MLGWGWLGLVGVGWGWLGMKLYGSCILHHKVLGWGWLELVVG